MMKKDKRLRFTLNIIKPPELSREYLYR